MTAKKKWLIAAAVVAALGLLGIAAVWIGMYLIPVGPPVNPALPVYTHDQTDSTHPWYRRSTVTCGTLTYVSDFEEAALLLAKFDPTNAIGRAAFGNALVCSIEGQSPADFIAVDCGSEMPAYYVYRNVNRPTFDWRHAKFQAMEFTGRIGRTEHKRTTDPALIADVVRTLSEGTPTTLSLPASITSHNISGLKMDCDELPGLVFCPEVYREAAGAVYLAESMGSEFTNRTVQFHARWIPASPLFTEWVKTP